MRDTVASHFPGVILSSLSIRIFSLLCIAAASAAHGAPAQPPAARPVNDDGPKEAQVREEALELARLMNPGEPMAALAARGFDQAFEQGLSGDEAAALEKAHPGFLAELRKATRDIVIADVIAGMPAIHRRYARFFSDRFTTSEIAELTEFYRTPTGARIITAKFANVDMSNLVGKVVDDPDAKLSTADIAAVNEGAASALWKGMTAEDMQSLLLFGLRPVARKLKDAAPAMAEIETEIANQPDPALDAAIDEATRKVYEKYGLAN